MNPILSQGYAEAASLTKKFARTFYFASRFLPPEKGRVTYALYAILRLADESVDDSLRGPHYQGLEKIKSILSRTFQESQTDLPIIFAFNETVRIYNIPKTYFDMLLTGMETDLIKNRYVNFSELYTYCYRVAGVVGLIMLRIFGYTDVRTQQHAVELGIALQLTNILRDIKEDYNRGRIYLPEEEMRAFRITESHFTEEKCDDAFIAFMKFQIQRARAYYARAEKGISKISDRNSRLVAAAIMEAYAQILREIEKNGYNVFKKRMYVSSFKKILLVIKMLIKGKYK